MTPHDLLLPNRGHFCDVEGFLRLPRLFCKLDFSANIEFVFGFCLVAGIGLNVYKNWNLTPQSVLDHKSLF